MIIGSFKSISYVDDDGDTVHCYTEDEATLAVFEEGISSFFIHSICGEAQKSENKGTCATMESVNVVNTPTIETSDNVDEEEECVIGDMPGMPLGSKEILSESHPMVNECLKLERKHLEIYDVRCGFTIDERSRNKPAIICELCDTSLNASNLSNIKSHMNNPTHRSNVYAMSGTDAPAETREDVELRVMSVKRYIRSNKWESELAVDESTDEPQIKCMKCYPTVFINIIGRGSFIQRSTEHIDGDKHKTSKKQRSISSLFGKARDTTDTTSK